MISEHASPLADLSTALAQEGHDVRVYSRREHPDQPAVEARPDGVHLVRVPAGPARVLPTDLLLPHLGDFAQRLGDEWRDGGWTPAVVHAHYWTSGLAA